MQVHESWRDLTGNISQGSHSTFGAKLVAIECSSDSISGEDSQSYDLDSVYTCSEFGLLYFEKPFSLNRNLILER